MVSVALALILQSGFVQEQMAFRKEVEASLTRPEGWLSVAGLYWLHEGTQTIGSGPTADVRLPLSAPELVGTVSMTGGKVSIEPQPGVSLLINGKEGSGALKADADGGPDSVTIGALTLAVIRRGERTGFRLWDPNCATKKEFKGCHWFPVSKEYVIRAKFTAHKPGTMVPITNVLGDTTPNPNSGYVEFTIKGKKCRLEAIDQGGGLFFNFQDATSGKETYAAGRFLNTEGPKDGFVTLDFNHAINPPCAYTKFATCPLPPKGNSLSVAIPAGEKKQHD